MKKLAIGMLLVMAASAAVGLVTVPAMTHNASASSAGASFGGFDSAARTLSASSTGPSSASRGPIAVCPDFVVIHGSCSESGP